MGVGEVGRVGGLMGGGCSGGRGKWRREETLQSHALMVKVWWRGDPRVEWRT